MSKVCTYVVCESKRGSAALLWALASIFCNVCLQDMMEACRTSGKFPGQVEFTGEETSKKGKMMSNCQTREALNWQPKYSSFEEFMAAGADDFYNTSPLYAAKPLGSGHSS